MSSNKQYSFKIIGRKANDGTVFPDYTSPTFKSARKAEKALWSHPILPGIACGGIAKTMIVRVR